MREDLPLAHSRVGLLGHCMHFDGLQLGQLLQLANLGLVRVDRNIIMSAIARDVIDFLIDAMRSKLTKEM
jgi:hypothetical protein